MKPLHRCALAGRVGLLVAVERCATPPDEMSSVLSGATTRSRICGNGVLVRNHDDPTGGGRTGCRSLGRRNAGVDPSTMSSRSYSARVASMFRSAGPSSSTDRCRPRSTGPAHPLAQQIHGIQHVNQGAAKTIDSPHDHGVASSAYSRASSSRSLDRGLLPEVNVREDVALLHPGGDEASSCNCAS